MSQVTSSSSRSAAPVLIRVSAQPRLSLLPTLRAAIARARREGGQVAVAAMPGAPEGAKHHVETALLALGLPADRLHAGDLPFVSRTPAAPPAEAALLDGLALFPTADEVQGWVAKLPADGRQAGEPKDPDSSPIFHAYALLADPMRLETMRLRYHGGISWEDARMALVQIILRATAEPARRQADLAAAASPLKTAV